MFEIINAIDNLPYVTTEVWIRNL